jgi:hypothetical protein
MEYNALVKALIDYNAAKRAGAPAPPVITMFNTGLRDTFVKALTDYGAAQGAAGASVSVLSAALIADVTIPTGGGQVTLDNWMKISDPGNWLNAANGQITLPAGHNYLVILQATVFPSGGPTTANQSFAVALIDAAAVIRKQAICFFATGFPASQGYSMVLTETVRPTAPQSPFLLRGSHFCGVNMGVQGQAQPISQL